MGPYGRRIDHAFESAMSTLSPSSLLPINTQHTTRLSKPHARWPLAPLPPCNRYSDVIIEISPATQLTHSLRSDGARPSFTRFRVPMMTRLSRGTTMRACRACVLPFLQNGNCAHPSAFITAALWMLALSTPS